MRNYFVIVLITSLCTVFGQNKDADKLKKYISYSEKDYDSWRGTTKHFFNDEGLIVKEENYSHDNKLRSRYEYYYDEYGNQYKKITTYLLSKKGEVNYEYDYELIVDDNGWVVKKGSGDFINVYSGFTDLGKPKLVVRKFSVGVDKHFYEYDSKGNILKWIHSAKWVDMDEKEHRSIDIIQYRYDKFNNVIRLHRSNDQKWEYPMIITGGPSHYEYEKYRYVYNRDGLWKIKFKTVEGKEYLIKKRKYTKR